MADFEDVRVELESLSIFMSRDLDGLNVIEIITVPLPEGIKDELYFQKLVAWCYVAFVEAFPIPLKQLANLIRANDGAGHRLLVETKDVVQALRTLRSHNLAKKSVSNQRQIALAEAWFVSNGGLPLSWEACCTSLASRVLEVFRLLGVTWKDAVAREDDRAIFLENLLLAIDGDWPAHTFDAAVAEAATSIGLVDFDVVAYRLTRIENWRKLAALFCDREVAMQAITRAITQELKTIFGSD
ncbi:hypothetical protein [Janthinobacterium svalbardensis]|uniref:hypothetical protein n=1 Tax=Janthinobacterium svalbardensis TaxID=368607 RepID=UPI002FCDD16B